ncbi:hypothetical protein GN958_ATG06039 [Phytophthora infestans]|uniref:Tudor domain-containing protein n=2 Tax=Phytophthora infestans TaxID=4787 RepID=A0A8S9UW24_PHYIN|nr:hypothetical protein GN958_ATG14832 [Phytophthora infestans]KAF4144871.1 hypothetical protein GN958_ATG06039 [Phytophthora infestans]
MKRSDRDPMRWVNQPIFKLEIDSHGHETQIRGKVMNYCPSSVRYLLMYEDGSSDGVPVDEIEDHVPLLLQLPNKRRRLVSADRQAAAQREECAAFHERPKRRKVSSVAKSKAATFDKEAVVSRFIRTTLCELTEVLDVSDDQRQTLMTALESGKEQPHAALTRYDQEGGLDALSHTLRTYARCGEDAATAKESSVKRESDRTQDSSQRRTAETSPFSPFFRSPCGQHLRELLRGKSASVFSPKATRSKEQHDPLKRERIPQHSPNETLIRRQIKENSMPDKTPEVVDLTGDGSEDEEDDDIEITPSGRRRLHFGVNSTVHFDFRDSVDVFRFHLRRTGHKRANLPRQSGSRC